MTKRLLPVAGLAALVLSTSCKPNSQSATAEPAAQASTPEPAGTAADTTASASVASSQQTTTGGQPQGDRPRGDRQAGGNGGGVDRQQRAAERMARMKTELALTHDQATKIEAIYTQQMGSMPQQSGDMTREERRAAFAKVREATNAQISQILTPEQKTKFETMQQERRNQRQQGGGQRGEGGQSNGGGN
jgi:Spy/CpxP family protein refolding chaperone